MHVVVLLQMPCTCLDCTLDTSAIIHELMYHSSGIVATLGCSGSSATISDVYM